MDDYELLPHEEIEHLRKEVEKLKKSPFPNTKENQNLLDSMDALTTSINKLIKIFEGAEEGIIQEYSESNPSKILKQISEQNTKIAEGVLAVAKMVQSSQVDTGVNIQPSRPNAPPMEPMPEPPQFDDFPDENKFQPEAFAKKQRRKDLMSSFEK